MLPVGNLGGKSKEGPDMRVDFETDVGAVRSSNQDSCDCGLFSPNSAWAIVCDGMGGANGGNVASAMAYCDS